MTRPTRDIRLVGRGELKRLLGVSYTRTVYLADQPDFPAPLDELSVGKIWALDDVLAWAQRKGRTLDLASLTTGVKAGGNSGPQSKSKS